MVSTYGRFAQAYGTVRDPGEVPRGQGGRAAERVLALAGQPHKFGAWPASGEIDIAEFYSQYADRVIPYIHYNSARTTRR